MKNIFCLLIIIFSSTLSAQKDTISNKKVMKSVVSADKVNVVYRGVSNPISIAVSGAKSFTASAPGLELRDGKYYLSPGAGNEVNVIVVYKDKDSIFVSDKHKFRVKNLDSTKAFINGSNCDNCIVEMTKKQLETAEITLKIEDFEMNIIPKLKSFTVKFDDLPTILVDDNKFNKKVLDEIKKLKKGDIFYIADLRTSTYYLHCGSNIHPIKVMIVE